MSVLSSSSVYPPLNHFKDGGLIILFDDIKTHLGVIVGLGKYVDPDKVNLMTKVGRGLVYACITEERAEQLQFPRIGEADMGATKPFAVSIDYKSTTTGISSFERSDTIKALTYEDSNAEDFKRPGHLFPLISKDNGLMARVDLTEAVVDLTKLVSDIHVGYMSEILNVQGEVASKHEVEAVAEENRLPMVQMSELLTVTSDQEICSFSGMVVNGRKLGRTIGFPTANLHPQQPLDHLSNGVYGVKVYYRERELIGVMNVGHRPTFNENESTIHYEVFILDFNEDIYWKDLQIKVCFFLREEVPFASISDLVQQINKDVDLVKNRFLLLTVE